MSLLICANSLQATEGVELWPAAPEASLSFGSAVAIDGDVAVVGASGYDTDGLLSAGAAYVFFRSASGWGEEARLVASDPGAIDLFGRAVAIDGGLVAVGAENHDQPVEYAGAVYVFAPQLKCSFPPGQICKPIWRQRAKLVGENQQDHFGHAVALSGTTLVVGTPFHDGDGPESGLVYVFGSKRRCSFSGCKMMWTRRAKLTASDGLPVDELGWSVAVDGTVVVAGAAAANALGRYAGKAYVFQLGPQGWWQIETLMAVGGTGDERFGEEVAVSEGVALLGNQRHSDPDVGDHSGAAYAYELGEPPFYADGFESDDVSAWSSTVR